MRRRKFLKIAAVFGGAAAARKAWGLASRSAAAEASAEAGPIVINQLGYLSVATKLATLRTPSATFKLRVYSNDAVVLQGNPASHARKSGMASF
jgi:hypothetical protein